MFKKTTLLTALTAITSVGAANAATISVSTTAPTVDGSDQANLVASTGGLSIYGDRPVQGQTFTTSADAGQSLLSLTVAISEGTGTPDIFEGWKDYLVRFGTVDTLSSGTLTPIYEEVTRQNDDLSLNDEHYHTFIFDTPIALAANTTYAFDIGVAGSQNGWPDGIPSLRRSGDSYAGGQRYQGAQTNQADTNYGINGTSGDILFHADIAVPEPGSLALLGLGGLMMIKRRRRA